ncbi:MAG: thioredoxin family protein [Bacteroidetes bacterium]|nr:thioredoxin family protein [Bacteroidota bacterium]MBS1745819.1 thioredoxin family protein [Bacteroidota bacterium]
MGSLIDTSAVRIIGLSVDSSPQKWIKALIQDDLPWKNYLLENDMRNPMIKKLGFDGIPMNILLDSKKTIIAQNTDIRKILKQIPIIATK